MAVPWFRHIPLGNFRRRLKQHVRNTARRHGGDYDIQRERPAPPTVSLRKLKAAKLGRYASLDGHKIKLFNGRNLASLYGVSRQTVMQWYWRGFLPDPVFTTKAGTGICLWYTYGQMQAIIRVLNDIFGQGYKQLDMRLLEQHKEMLDEGSARALKRLETYGIRNIKKDGGDFGVFWES